VARRAWFRLTFVAFLLMAANFGGYAFAYFARTRAGNPLFGASADATALAPAYLAYLHDLWTRNPAMTTTSFGDFFTVLGAATAASLGLLLIALLISTVLGLTLGLLGVRRNPPGVRGWITAGAIIGLSAPSFFIGRLAVVALLFLVIYTPWGNQPLPLQGFGWDLHLVLPVTALVIRPTAQIAQVTAGLLAGELGRQYIVAARGKGIPERRIVAHHALRNVWAPLTQAIAGTVRLLVSDAIVVEWLFAWPGLGFLMAATLVPAQFASASVASSFMDPPLVASLLTIFAGLFVLTDLTAGALARLADPRQREA
jgi:peptide/nickel transport system permease protein